MLVHTCFCSAHTGTNPQARTPVVHDIKLESKNQVHELFTNLQLSTHKILLVHTHIVINDTQLYLQLKCPTAEVFF